MPELTIQLSSDDAKKFAELTERAVGSRLLMMLGERPLIAPLVRFLIQGGCMSIDDTNVTELKKMEHDLKKLIR